MSCLNFQLSLLFSVTGYWPITVLVLLTLLKAFYLSTAQFLCSLSSLFFFLFSAFFSHHALHGRFGNGEEPE